jgi:hypothetical protein
MTHNGLTVIGEEDALFDDIMKVLEEEREERRAIYFAAALPASMPGSILSESERETAERRRRGKLYD